MYVPWNEQCSNNRTNQSGRNGTDSQDTTIKKLEQTDSWLCVLADKRLSTQFEPNSSNAMYVGLPLPERYPPRRGRRRTERVLPTGEEQRARSEEGWMSGSRQKRSKAAASKQINAVTELPDYSTRWGIDTIMMRSYNMCHVPMPCIVP